MNESPDADRWTWSGDSPRTWYVHTAVAIAAPPLAAWPTGWGIGGMAVVSLAVLGAFGVREWRDTVRKRADGTWSDKWRRDRAGDLLGAVTAAACYAAAWLVAG